MSFNESENLENRTTQPELTELYQQTQKTQAKTEQPKQSKPNLAKGSASEQLENAIIDAQEKALEGGKLGTKAAIVAGKERGKKQFQDYKKAKDVTFLNLMAEDEVRTASQLINGVSGFNSTIDEVSGTDVELLLDEDEEITRLKKDLELTLNDSKKSQTTNNFLFG